MTGIQSRLPSSLERVVLPEPGIPVTIIHFGLLLMYLIGPEVKLHARPGIGHPPQRIVTQRLQRRIAF
jgi:hypothetical protein